MLIRPATPDDAEAMSSVLIASITRLCTEDHRDSPVAIAEWTANKSPEGIRSWFGNPQNRLFVAQDEGGALVAVGGFQLTGEITLNYVAPGARFKGISRAMLNRLEGEMIALGLTEAKLDSTRTALSFYRSAGWQEQGTSTKFACTTCLKMTKALSQSEPVS